MQLHALKLATAAAITSALLFIACWLLIAVLPGAATTATEHRLHVSMDNIDWNMSPVGFIVGTLSWTFGTGTPAILTGTLYNRFCEVRRTSC